MDLYAQVFSEAAHAASIIPLSSDATLVAMKSFGNFNMQVALALAYAGSLVGCAFNWLVGDIFSRTPTAKTHTRAQKFFRKFGIYIVLLSPLPLMNFTVLAAGYLRVSFLKTLLLCAIGYAGHYAWFML